MFKHYFFALFFSCLLLFASASHHRKVLLIGIDGTRSDALQQANTPNLDGLLPNATYSFNSWHTGITWSGPSWSTILTGVNWNKHGVTDNNFTVTHFDQYPPIPTLAKEVDSTIKCAIVAEWDPLIDNIVPAAWDRKIKTADGSTMPTADSAIIELQDTALDFLFVYFDQVDLTGHTSTFSPNNPFYIAAIENVDSAIGRVLHALYARPTYSQEDWLIMAVTDHGGTGFTHGGNSDAERRIWWIASGDMVAHEQINEPDPGTYNCNLNSVFDSACVNDSLLRLSPVQTDAAVTALHYLIYDSGINPENKPEWHLDGRSWLQIPNGIAETKVAPQFSIYPNPGHGMFTINYSKNRSITEVTIFDLMGREIESVKPQYGSDKIQLDMSGQAAGTYIVQLKNGAQRSTGKITLLP